MLAIESMCPDNVKTLVKAILKEFDKSKLNVKYEDRNCLHLLIAVFYEPGFMNQDKNQDKINDIAECIKILVEAGCDLNAPDKDNRTPSSMLLEVEPKLLIDADLHKELIQYFFAQPTVYFDRSSVKIMHMLDELNIKVPAPIEQVIDANYLKTLLYKKKR